MKQAKTMLVLAISACMCIMYPLTMNAQQKTGFHILKKHKIGGTGGWDYITVDSQNKRMYVSHATQVHILSIDGDSIGVIEKTNGVHGIALAKPFGKGYTSNGRDNSCTVFNLKTDKPVGTIAVGSNPDAIFFDQFSKKVFVFNGRSNDATVIDPATDKVLATISIGGKPETGVSDGRGKVYVNSETTNEVVVINAKTFKVEKRFKIIGGDEPSGLAIDPVTNRLFIGCGGNQTFVVMDANTGKNLAKFPIGNCDGVVFDPALKLAYSSNGEGTLSVIREVNAGKFEFVENIQTERSARTIALDPATHHVFLPAAQTQEVAPTADNANPRAKIVPGSFHVIEIGK
ncbi:MAG: hypothetical protein JWQ28_3218 [Pedobacter sp.]|nr:hypothetical protein [Pedobacter sp.]